MPKPPVAAAPPGPHPLLRLAPWVDLVAKALAAVAAGLAIAHQIR